MKIKAFLFFILSSFSFFCGAQNLKAFLYTATFNSPSNKPYIETYLSFDANSIKLKFSERNGYFGELDILIEVIKESTIVYSDHYKLKSPFFVDSVSNNQLFIDQQRIALKNGEYDLKLTITDLHETKNKLTHSEKINVDFKENKLALSDIELVENYTKTEVKNKLSKSGYDLIPYVSNFYPPLVEKLNLYFEIYNSDKHFSLEKRYLLNTYIETYETKVALFDYTISKRMFAKALQSNFYTFPIEKLPTGNYNLVCEIKDVKNNSVIKKKLLFQRSGLKHNKSLNDISSIDIDGTFVEKITNGDSLLLFIDYLYPIATNHEITFADNQKRYNNLLLIQKYILNFWKGRNLHNPEQEWENYKSVVIKVNKEFRNAKIPGYKTDRGRVFLQYGVPNSRHKVENSSANVPYEIWHYYKLRNKTNCKFVFVNEHLGIQDYKLTYSNVDGEVSNAEWRDKIKQDQNPTFGDDFNNNYINPR